MDTSFLSQRGGRNEFKLLEVEDATPEDSRLIPLLLSGTFVVLQLVYALLFLYRRCQRKQDDEANCDDSVASANEDESGSRAVCLRTKLWIGIQLHGGSVIVGFMVARFVGTLLLLYLSATTSVESCKITSCSTKWTLSTLCTQDSLTIAFAYATLLAVLSFWPKPLLLSPGRLHVTVSLSILGVYSYRDLWPLARHGSTPADHAEGMVLWVKIVLLVVTSVIIPLFIPHAYVPVDLKNPSLVSNPEQTASWISALTYSYMDPLIMLANNVPHLRHDQLPPLSDYDHANYLSGTASKFVDPFAGAKRHHLFFGLLGFFRREFTIIFFGSLLHAASTFVSPIGINRTLTYLENRDLTTGAESSIKPWLWALLMLVGPVTESGVKHWNSLIQTKVRVRIQAVLTQLFFEHSLRIRMRAETSSEVVDSVPTVSQSQSEESEEAIDTEVNQDTTSGGSSLGQGTAKGKTKADEGPPSHKSSSGAQNLIGRINNLVTSDLQSITEGCDFPSFFIVVSLQITLSIVFLYNILGWAAFAGLFTTLTLSPVVAHIGRKVQDVQVTKMKLTDARVQSISEAVGILRMIKLFGWERKMTKRLETKRDEELAWLWSLKRLKLANDCASILAPTVSTVVTYAVYTVIMKQELTASKIFSSMAVDVVLREQLSRVAGQYTLMIEAKVSLDRASVFLQESELLDSFSKEQDPTSAFSPGAEENQNNHETDIGFKNATFSWSNEEDDGSLTPSSRTYRLRFDGELLFKRNCINLIIGPTGSGKTSILMALLGEMHFIPAQADSWYNLPRNGGVAYAAQESWVQNATIRENIIFGSPVDEERYQKVIHQCALEHDLELFDAGDETEVGERGLTLSGGQKARVTLARAIYSSAEIILLDDVLAALDVHTSTWIVDHCFRGDLVKGRTILLITHNVALAGPIAEFVISLSLDGTIDARDNKVTDSMKLQEVLAAEAKKPVNITQEKTGDATPAASPDGKLVIAEEIVQGHITWKSLKLLLAALAGKRPTVFGLVWIGGLVLCQMTFMMQPWFLGVWGSQYEKHAPSEVNLSFYLLMFSAILSAGVLIYAGINYYFSWRSIKASKVIHAELVDSVFGSTLRWLDETPTSRILTRFTQDIRAVDEPIPHSLMWVGSQSIGLVGTLGGIVVFSPIFIVPGILAAVVGIYAGNLYMRAQLSIKREMSNARAPLLAHFSAAIQGLVSIRAYGSQKTFANESYKRIDHYSRTARTSWTINRWIGFRIDTLGALFTSALALYLIYGPSISAANTGFSLYMAFGFTLYVFWLIRVVNDLEVESNSLERIQAYIDIDHEPKSTSVGQPPAAWPTSGDLRVEGLSARYSQAGPKVLHDLSFHITSGQRIGVVGRTGSGKSSLTLALLRCILTEGKVFYDGTDTNAINLDVLRSNITIIPQTPELLSGTLRQNLDPFDQNDDAILNEALRASGLFSLQEDAGETRLTLDSQIAGGGNNLSVGQRQIIALARAMVRGSKLLILDEATSAIDYKTDGVIQNTLRDKLGPDVTVITIAHRLQTIMDADKIMVLDNGKIVEFDAPKVLLQRTEGALRALVDGSGDRTLLHTLAGSN